MRTIENYRPLDDDFMRELFRNDLPLAQLVLRIITGIDDLQLTSQETQYDLNRLTEALHRRERDTIQVRLTWNF